jgi:hypothetical protein
MVMIDANELKPAEEKLKRDEYVLDIAERDRLIAQADREQEQLREDIQFEVRHSLISFVTCT